MDVSSFSRVCLFVSCVLSLAASSAFLGCGEDSVGTGEGTLTLVPEVIDFGNEGGVGGVVDMPFDLVNAGGSTVTISEFRWGGDSSAFRVDDAAYDVIEPGESVTYTATFSPSNLNALEATLEISHDGAESPAVLTLLGQGYSADEDGDGFTVYEGDCNDLDPEINPDQGEYCNGVDDDCNGKVDDDARDALSWYPDEDGDGYGVDTWRPEEACADDAPEGTADNTLDCNDADASISPAQTEVCDQTDVDEDCDGEINEDTDGNGDGVPDCRDQDGDGFTGLEGDCDDTDASSNPGTLEQPDNQQDDDCDGLVDENAPPFIEIISPGADGELVAPSPATTTLSAFIQDDYDSYETIRVEFYLDSVSLCGEAAPDETGMADCLAGIELGEHELIVLARDEAGETNSVSKMILADTPPVVTYSSPGDGSVVSYGESIAYIIEASDDDGDVFEVTDVQWSSSLQGSLTPDLVPPVVGEGQLGANIALTYPGEQQIYAQVVDSLGVIGAASITVTVTEPEDCPQEELRGLWHMDEGSGSIINSAVNSLTGDLSGVSFQGGLSGFGDTLSFSAENSSRVEIEDSSRLLALQSFTVDLWYRPTTSPSGNQTARQALVYKGGDSSTNAKSNYYLAVNELGYIQATVTRSEGVSMVATGLSEEGATQLISGNWYHVAMTYDGRYIKVYVNGREEATTDAGSSGATLVQGSAPLYLGVNPNDLSPRPYTLTAQLDDLQVMGCVLTSEAIAAIYQSSAPHPDPVSPTPIPDDTPDTTPDITPMGTPDTTPVETPVGTPEATPAETPVPTPDPTPSITPEWTPESSPGTTPDVTPASTPEPSPGTTPSTTPDVTPASTPEVTPVVTPAANPETATPSGTPETTPSVNL